MENNRHDLTTVLYNSKWGKQLVPPKYNEAIVGNSIICEKCNKEYKNKYSLWLHSKTCSDTNLKSETNTNSEINHETISKLSESQFQHIVINLIQQNNNLINKNIELTDKNKLLTDKILEPLQSQNVSSFNLNFYLNSVETDKVNTDEFITSVKSDIKEIEGLDKSIDVSNVITKKLGYLEIPSSDVKKITSYTKSDKSWIKDK